MATGTHGSSLSHSILSENVIAFKIVLANGSVKYCSKLVEPDLFQAGLVSLGALGVIVEVTLLCTSRFKIRAKRRVTSVDNMLHEWETNNLWQAAEFVRVWWYPCSDKTVTWTGERVDDAVKTDTHSSWYRNVLWAHHIHQAMLYVQRYVPRLNGTLQRAVFNNVHGYIGDEVVEDVQHSVDALNMDCLFKQYTNEWALPLANGVEACKRLRLWLSGAEIESQIPYSSKGLNIHGPIEIRVANRTLDEPWLSTTCQGPVCYIGIIQYKAYNSATAYRRYFEAYEYLMRSLGGRPHWAKQHSMSVKELRPLYPNLQRWLDLRQTVDPYGLFTTEYHHRHLLTDREPVELGVRQGMAGRMFKARL